jgi:excisionase family DNA binding protein
LSTENINQGGTMSEWVRPWLSPEDLAAELDVPLRSVYQWNHKGTGPSGKKIGRHIRYSRDAVDKWLADRTEVGGGNAA